MRVNMGREGRASSSLSANGGTMLGVLILANGPSQPLEAATKYYVDSVFANLNANNIVDGILPISSLPGFTGDAANIQGSNSFSLANLGVTPGGYPKVIVDAKGRVTGNDILSSFDIPDFSWNKVSGKPSTLDGYGITDGVETTGDTITANLTVPTPAGSMSIVNKQYVDSALSDNSTVVGDIIRKPYTSTPAGFLRCNGGQVDKTTYADLYAVIGDNFANNTIPGSGKPWEQQYAFNDLQSGNIVGWVNGGSVISPCLYHQCVVTKHRIYMIGGGQASGHWANVYTTQVQSDGALNGWSQVTSLPIAFAYFSAFVVKNRLYVAAGGNENTALNTVMTAPINADGTLGTWSYSGNLPIALYLSHVVVLKDRVYLIGGSNGSTSVASIYVATINSDGTLNAWTLSSSTLPVPVSAGHIAVTKNRIYLIGGAEFVNTIYTCVINGDGSLGTWSQTTPFPININVGCCVVTNKCVYMLGGAYALNSYTANCYKSNINSDGTLGSWELMPATLPWVTGYSSAVIVRNKIYIIAGYLSNGVSASIMTAQFSNASQDYSPYYGVTDTTNYMMPGSGKPWQQQYQTNILQNSAISGWVAESALPVSLGNSAAIVTKNRVYICGGGAGGTNSVYTAPINTDGTLGTWALDTALPVSITTAQVVVTKTYAYLMGGYNGAYVSTVYKAPINSDGTLGTWTTSDALPGVLGMSSAVVTKNRVYLIGGYSTGWSTTVYTAPINSDGTLGAWATASSLPSAVGAAGVAVTKNRVYLIGGWNAGGLSTVYTATISSDGYIGPWSTGPSLPAAVGYTSVFVTSTKIYVLGGYAGAGVATTYTADIAADGTISSWVTSTALSAGFSHSTLVATSSRIYLIGGYDSNFSASVFSAPISGGLNDYSAYYDGTVLPVEPASQSNKFYLPDFSTKERNGQNYYIKF